MFCTVGEVQLYYEVRGAGAPLILLHGNGESHEIFDRAVPELAKTHRVFTPDSRCHGRSTRTKDIRYELMAEDMIGFIRALGLEKPVFYGFSDGGIVGLLIAVREPQLLGRLILSGANLDPGGLTLGTRLATRLRALTGDPLYRLMAREPHITDEQLQGIAVPTVVLAGEHDVIRRAHTERIARNIPGSTLELLPGEGHGSYIVHSEKLSALLQKYL